jgi:hypothetical protein
MRRRNVTVARALRRPGVRNGHAYSLADVHPERSAEAAGLRYVQDGRPGIRRRRAGPSFRYVDADGAPVTDEMKLRRIRSLAIPPAWQDVWICARADALARRESPHDRRRGAWALRRGRDRGGAAQRL